MTENDGGMRSGNACSGFVLICGTARPLLKPVHTKDDNDKDIVLKIVISSKE